MSIDYSRRGLGWGRTLERMLKRLIRNLRASFQVALAERRPVDFVPTLRDYPMARPSRRP
jgi:hypothetical protein